MTSRSTFKDADGSIALISVDTPVGRGGMLGQVRIEGATMFIDKAHVDGLSPGRLGRSGINAVSQKLPVEADVERLVIQGETRSTGRYTGRRPRPASSPVEIRIKRPSVFVHPVALAKLLRENGLRLAEAHDAVNRLANEHVVDLILRPSDCEGVLAKMRALGLEASVSTERHAAVF